MKTNPVYIALMALCLCAGTARATDLSQQFDQQSQAAADAAKAQQEAAAKAREAQIIAETRADMIRVVTAMAKLHGGIKEWNVPTAPLMTIFPGITTGYCSNIYWENTCTKIDFETNDGFICEDPSFGGLQGISYVGNIYRNTLLHYSRTACVRDNRSYWMNASGKVEANSN